MNAFQKIKLLPLVLAFSLVSTNVHADAQEKCEGWLRRTGARMARGWQQFREEVREQGKIRYVLAPRHDGSRFNGWAAFLDPLIDLPIESYSYVSAKYFDRPLKRRLSIFTSLPVGMIAWGALLVGLDLKAEQWALEGIEHGVNQDISGAAYTAEYVLSGAITPGDGRRILERYQQEGVHGLDNLRLRADQFQSLNIWRPDQVATLKKILLEIQALHTPAEVSRRESLEKILKENAPYQKFLDEIPQASRYTAQLLIEPRVVLRGRADAYWLSIFFEPFRYPNLTKEQAKGLASLERIYKFHSRDLSLATLSSLVADTLGNRDGIRDKVKEAARLGLDRDSDFIYRGSVPLFSQPGEFTDLGQKITQNSELERWNLLLKDPRFQIIRRDWERGEISDLVALLRTDIQARALSQVYQMATADENKLSGANACTLIFGKAQNDVLPNPLFVRLRQAPAHFQYALAENYFLALLEAGETKTAAGYEAALSRAQERELTVLRASSIDPEKIAIPPLKCGS